MRASRATIFLAVGVVLALLAGGLVYLVAQQAATAPNPLADTTPIVVAKVDIPERTVLTAEMLELRAYPKTLQPAGAIADIGVAARQTTLVKIPIGAPILATQIAAGGGTTGISLTIEKGKVLVAFPVSDALTSSKKVVLGDHVDILVTITPELLQPALAARTPAPTTAPAPTATPAAGASPALAPTPTPSPLLPGPVTQTVVQNLEVAEVVGNVLLFVVDHQTALILKNLKDSGANVDIVIRSRAESDIAQTKPVDPLYIVNTYGFRQ